MWVTWHALPQQAGVWHSQPSLVSLLQSVKFVSHVISQVSGWPTLVSPLAVVGSFLFSAAVGVFFGFYPARKASRLNPIAALRHD